MPPSSTRAKIPPRPLSSTQRRRREDNRYRAAERQLLYPRLPDSRERITRQSPRTLFPSVPETRSCRVVCEHPTKAPNEYLYLLQSLTADTAIYAFYLPDGSVWRSKTFPSIYAACVAAAQAGYLDASW